MNDVRRSALRRILISAAFTAPVFVYLWRVDYAGATMAPHALPFCVALLTPAALVIRRSAKDFFSTPD